MVICNSVVAFPEIFVNCVEFDKLERHLVDGSLEYATSVSYYLYTHSTPPLDAVRADKLEDLRFLLLAKTAFENGYYCDPINYRDVFNALSKNLKKNKRLTRADLGQYAYQCYFARQGRGNYHSNTKDMKTGKLAIGKVVADIEHYCGSYSSLCRQDATRAQAHLNQIQKPEFFGGYKDLAQKIAHRDFTICGEELISRAKPRIGEACKRVFIKACDLFHLKS